MSSFKTRKIPNTAFESKKITPKHDDPKTPLHESTSSNKRKIQIFVGSLLGILVLVFFGNVIIRAFQGNEKNGSENFNVTPPTIEGEEFVTQKISGTTNILIAGIGGAGHDGGDLTDSIMLASLDHEKDTVTLLSLPRDLYVAYPEKRGAGRINSLYDLGKRDKVGIGYLANKVSEITGQSLDHYIVIDFSGFKKVIDILGGVTVNVPEDLLDREYPNNNWGYTTFSVKKGVQVFDGETALKYARSRHSTSDFDRSNRQQIIIKSIKEKATDLGVITDISKIGEIYDALLSHLDTDLSIASMADIALSFSDIKSEDISIISLSDFCLSITKCSPGAYLYAPSRDLFGGNAVIIPENAHVNKLSYYDDIRRFVDLTFRFPKLRSSARDIMFIADPSMRKKTQEIAIGLAKLGFPVSFEKTITVATGSIEKSHINIYWNSEFQVGINPNSPSVEALKYIDESIPYTLVERNEYINTSGPKIEIVIGKDAGLYFKNIKPVYYIPAPPKETVSGENTGTKQVSTGKVSTGGTKKSIAPLSTLSGEKKITTPGEWEEF